MFGLDNFTNDQIERYSRHILLSEIGGEGQGKIAQAKVLIVGAGGLGSPCAFYLAAAGVGTLGIVDFDKVELNNLQRQILHVTKDVGRPKVESAKERITQLNPDVKVITHSEKLTSQNTLPLVRQYDILVDGSDNFPTRYLMNDAAVLTGRPLVHGGIFRFDGQLFTILPRKGPCYRCLFAEPPPPGLVPSCQEAGILGAVAGTIGVMQATEVLKLILGIGDLLTDRLLIFNALRNGFREVKIRRDLNCPACGDHPTLHALIDYEQFCNVRK
ncbi:MAG: molybdopterin-synthase adenylyltransferase MoeB [Candidatus Omnitrophica bacterium]|nr:molybdopterin-synthase adenylyltransferase MoeB [Candidatus Omnitrophota bacterium]